MNFRQRAKVCLGQRIRHIFSYMEGQGESNYSQPLEQGPAASVLQGKRSVLAKFSVGTQAVRVFVMWECYEGQQSIKRSLA